MEDHITTDDLECGRWLLEYSKTINLHNLAYDVRWGEPDSRTHGR